jgi:hypothetical protein
MYLPRRKQSMTVEDCKYRDVIYSIAALSLCCSSLSRPSIETSINSSPLQPSIFMAFSSLSPPTSTASISATFLASASIRPWISSLSSVLSCPNSHSSCIWRVRVKMSSLVRIWEVGLGFIAIYSFLLLEMICYRQRDGVVLV